MRTALFGALILLAVLQLVGATAQIHQGWRDFETADAVAKRQAVGRDLLDAARNSAKERILVLAGLGLDPGDTGLLAPIPQHRAAARTRLETARSQVEAFQVARGSRFPVDISSRVAEMEAAAASVDALRPAIDADLARPWAERSPELRDAWAAATEALIGRLMTLLSRIGLSDPVSLQPATPGAALAGDLVVESVHLRQAAGDDVIALLRLGAARQSPAILGAVAPAQQLARILTHWDELRTSAAAMTDPGVAAALANAQSRYFEAFLTARATFLALDREPRSEDIRVFAVAGLDGLAALTDMAVAGVLLAETRAMAGRDAALGALGWAAANLLLSLAAIAVALIVVKFRVLGPIAALATAMRGLADGRTDIAVPGGPADGEVADMLRAVRVFKQAAVRNSEIERQRFQAERLLAAERVVLELAARRMPLAEVLTAICRTMEEQAVEAIATVALTDRHRPTVLKLAAAPSLPQPLAGALDNIASGLSSGSCCAAVYRKETVICPDIASDPLWKGDGYLTLDSGLRACWSVPILSGEGEVLGAFAFYLREARGPTPLELDVSQRASHLAAIAIANHRAEEQLEQAKAAAEQGSRTKSEFLANMSHELRTPLNAIIGFAEVLDDELRHQQNPIANAGYAADIIASGKHLLTLINDILDVSKMEAGKLELRERICDVSELLRGCERTVRARSMERRLSLIIDRAETLPPVLMDDVKFKQIILNLLSNAIKFTAPGGKVTVTATADPGQGLRVAIADTGIGIRAEDLPKVFIPFHQIDNIYARVSPGTGLGLSLSKGLAELHGGKLLIESVFGEGTVATLVLPPSRLLGFQLGEARAAG